MPINGIYLHCSRLDIIIGTGTVKIKLFLLFLNLDNSINHIVQFTEV